MYRSNQTLLEQLECFPLELLAENSPSLGVSYHHDVIRTEAAHIEHRKYQGKSEQPVGSYRTACCKAINYETPYYLNPFVSCLSPISACV